VVETEDGDEIYKYGGIYGPDHRLLLFFLTNRGASFLKIKIQGFIFIKEH